MARPSPSIPIALLVASGCASARPTEEIPVETASPTAERTSGPRSTAGYEVHEWGLVRADVGDVLNTGAVPPMDPQLMIMDKPVLYFHAASPMVVRNVAVHTPHGSILETWPMASGEGADASWLDVELGPSSDCIVSRLPQRADPACARLAPTADCESTMLGIVRTEDASCVHAAGTTDRFLFYRARTEVFAPPLRFTRAADGVNVTIENESAFPIPGMVVRIRNHDGMVASSAVLPPTPHAKIVMGFDAVVPMDESDKSSDRKAVPASGAGPDAVRMTMTELGMSPAETQAFLDAWSETLFMPNGFNGFRAPSDAILYFLPAASIDTIAKLSFDPAPRAVKRAFAVWSAIDSFVPIQY